MKEVVDWAMTNIGPNVIEVHQRPADDPAAARVGRDRRVRRSGTPRAGSSTWRATRRRRCSCRATIYPANGYLWIPKNAPHPVLAQIFMNWRLDRRTSSSRTPGRSTTASGASCREGFLGPDYVDLVPDWFKADYVTYFPTLDQIKTDFKTIDWAGVQRQPRSCWTTTLEDRPVAELTRKMWLRRRPHRGRRADPCPDIEDDRMASWNAADAADRARPRAAARRARDTA